VTMKPCSAGTDLLLFLIAVRNAEKTGKLVNDDAPHIHVMRAKKATLNTRLMGFARMLFPARTVRTIGLTMVMNAIGKSHKRPNKKIRLGAFCPVWEQDHTGAAQCERPTRGRMVELRKFSQHRAAPVTSLFR
jgi:hypothetical protein